MRSRSTVGRTGVVASLFSLFAAGVFLWLFAPTSIGGTFSYVIVTGNSMAPGLVTGNLVLLRTAGDYEVGDAVTYRHPELGPVLHRIVADDGERFTLRGDNRGGDDGYQPTRGDVIGRQWIAVPKAGRVIQELQRPRNLALLIAATVLVGVAGGASSRRLRRMGPGARLNAVRSRRDLSVYSQSGRQALVLGLGLAAGSLTLLALYTVSGPTRQDTEPVPFTERGEFSYGGQITGGVYDEDRLTAPQPLYRQLTEELPVNFSYELTAPEAAIENVIGTVELVVVVGSEDGWTRTFAIEPVTRFASGQLEVQTTLDLAALDRDLVAISEQTGVASGLYVVDVVARVEAAGSVDGLSFESSYEHFARFRLGALELRFDGTPEGLVLAESRSVRRPITVARVLDLPMVPLSLGYAQFPAIGAVGLGVAAGLLFAVARVTSATRRRGEAARIRAAYSMLIVEVAQARAAFGPPPHDVGQCGDLVRLASAEGLAIMHRSSPRDDEYFVTTSDRSWRYAVTKPLPAVTAPAGSLITTGEG